MEGKMGNKYYKVIDTDVCVIGASSSGIPAALHAAGKGAKVVLIDKMKRLGGSMGIVGALFAVESPAQKRLGIHTTAEECFQELVKLLYWNCDARLVHNWLNDSGESIRWLESLGLKFDLVESFQGKLGQNSPTHRTCHTMDQDPGSGHPGLQMLKKC